MFTGIVDHGGTITQIETRPESQRIWIRNSFENLMLGESIAVDGICLTVTQIQQDIFCCDISPETGQLTTAKNFKLTQKVNLERALQLSSRLGGHVVMGHIDQVCQVKTMRHIADFIEIIFSGVDKQTKKFIIKKGSIAVNGVSLTINTVSEKEFSVMLIPHTLERTNLIFLHEGDTVNIEFDMMARMIVEQCQQYFAAGVIS